MSASTQRPSVRSWTPEVEFWDHDMPDPGVYRGLDGLLRWQADWERSWESWDSEALDLIDAGDRVVAIVRSRAKGRHSGVEVERVDGSVWTLRAGKVTRVDYYGSREEAFRAVGLAG
jgi:ketosteroid isomerase-like protein